MAVVLGCAAVGVVVVERRASRSGRAGAERRETGSFEQSAVAAAVGGAEVEVACRWVVEREKQQCCWKRPW